MPRPTGERITVEEVDIREGGASDKLRTAMAEMEVEGEEMD